MWIWRSTILSPPGHNTMRIHKHDWLTQYTLNVFFFTTRQTQLRSSSSIQIQSMWCISKVLMDPTVFSPGKSRGTRRTTKTPAGLGLHTVCLKRLSSAPPPPTPLPSTSPSWVLISHSRPLCMNVNRCSESMQNRIINHIFHGFFVP